MAEKKKPVDPLFRAFTKAKADAWRNSGVRLTESDFMNTIDPNRKYTDENARYFMRKVREGEWTSKNAIQRSNSGGGQIYNVLLKNQEGFVVDSAVVEVPVGRSLYEAYQDGSLEEATRRYVEARYSRGEKQNKKYGIESIGRGSLKGLSIAGLRPLVTTRKPVQIIRRK